LYEHKQLRNVNGVFFSEKLLLCL